MIKHIVMIKLKPDRKDEIEELRRKLDSLANIINVIRYFETGINISRSPSAYDLVLITEFDTIEDLEKYRVDPEHQKVKDYIANIKDVSVVVDFVC